MRLTPIFAAILALAGIASAAPASAATTLTKPVAAGTLSAVEPTRGTYQRTRTLRHWRQRLPCFHFTVHTFFVFQP